MKNFLKFFTKKKIIYLGAIALVIAGGIYYQRSKKTSTAVQYKTAEVEKGNIISSVSASGNVIVDQDATVDPTITGTVTNLSVKVGDKVEKGQLLFSIDNDQLSVDLKKSYASYLQSLGSLESAKATKKEAKVNYEDASSSQKSITKQKLESAEASVAAAEESVSASMSDYQNKKSNAAKRNVTAPISGTVNAVNIKNGDDLSRLSSNSNSSAPIIIGDLNTLKAEVQVNEVDMPSISIGQKATLKFDALQNESFEGKVDKIDSLGTITQGVVTYNVVVNFEKKDSRIRPEMSVSAEIMTGEKQNVLTISNSALKNEGNNYYVQILNNQKPERKNVKIGIANNIKTEILSGIQEGDKVVTQTIGAATTAASSSRGGFGPFGH